MMRPRDISLLGSYQVVRALSADLCVAEYAAEHLFLGRQFKMSIVVHDDLYQPVVQETMVANLGEFSRLSHPDMLHIYDVQQIDRVFFFTSTMVAGEPLRARFARAKISTVNDFAEFFGRLGEIVLYLQSKSISCQNLSFADIEDQEGEWCVSRINWLAGAEKLIATEDEHLTQYLATARGPFYQKGFYDTGANIRRMGDLMYEAVAWGKLDDALEIRRREEEGLSKKKKTQARVRLVNDIPLEIEELIVRTRLELEQGGYRSLKEMFDEIASLKKKPTEQEAEVAGVVQASPVAAERASVWELPPISEVSYPQSARKHARVLQWTKSLGVIVLVLAGAAAIIVAVLSSYSPLAVRHNREPTARATASPRVTFAGGEIELDASSSFDPDGDDLIYHWDVAEPRGAKVQFSTNDSRAAGRVTARFSNKGAYKIMLRVHDGAAFSAPAYVTVVVY